MAVMNPKEENETRQEKLFDPPLWRQRRVYASECIKSNNIRTVLDIGCGEGALLQILLNDTQYSHLAGLDVDLLALGEAERACAPSQMDHSYPRELPVHFALYYGSLVTPDERFQSFDCITMLEVIEHLESDVLYELPRVVFGLYQPKLVIISTPNAEFNINFENLKYGTSEQQFRHWDHKFEWTRDEFKEWCDGVCSLYGYSVDMDGVGVIDKSQTCGTCTQFAVFKRIGNNPKPVIDAKPLQIKYQVDYPYFEDDDFTNEEIWDLVVDHARYLVDEKEEQKQLQVKQLWSVLAIRQYCKYSSKLVQVLEFFDQLCTLSDDKEVVTFFLALERPNPVPYERDWDSEEEEEEIVEYQNEVEWGDSFDKNEEVDTSENCWQ